MKSAIGCSGLGEELCNPALTSLSGRCFLGPVDLLMLGRGVLVHNLSAVTKEVHSNVDESAEIGHHRAR